jgi:hypothetical protein
MTYEESVMETAPLFPPIDLPIPTDAKAALKDEARKGEQARDAGILRVSGHHPEWSLAALEALRKWGMAQRDPWALEEFRAYWQMTLKMGPAPHDNLWGALTKNPAFKAHFAPTGVYRKSFHAAAHGRKVALYFRKMYP